MSITFNTVVQNDPNSIIQNFICKNLYIQNLYPSGSAYFGGISSGYISNGIVGSEPDYIVRISTIPNEYTLIESTPFKAGDRDYYFKIFMRVNGNMLSVRFCCDNDPISNTGLQGDYATSATSWRFMQLHNISKYVINDDNTINWQGIGVAIITSDDQAFPPTGATGNSYWCWGIRCVNWNNFRNDVKEYSEEVGEMSQEGGYTGGTFDDSSDVISIPTMPTVGVTTAGFINVYKITQSELIQFGAELFPNLSFTPVSQGGSPSSVTDALVAMAQVLVDFGNQIPQIIDMYINSNLINYVIDCHIIPVAPSTGGSSPLKVGFKTFSQNPLTVTSDYVDFDCGNLNVGEYYANFIDYAPYTRAKLYLPFVGFVDLAPEYWQSGTLDVKYRFNIIDGSFVAFVISTSSKSKLANTVIAQFGGNACVHIPITGQNYANTVSGLVSAVSPLLPSATGGVGDALVNVANSVANNKPNIQQSNGYNSTTSFLTVRVPYLLIERSVSNFSRKYADENGIPCNITCDFSALSGLTKATMQHMDGIHGATDDDLDEIAQLLSEGIIL